MLVLSRKKQEGVFVGDISGVGPLVKVTVLDIIGRNVRLGFEAEADIPILRSELCEWDQAQGSSERRAPASGVGFGKTMGPLPLAH